jgi:hypothetical protein
MGHLGQALDAAAHRIASCEQIVAAAKQAFKLQRQWYSCEPLGRPHAPKRAA